MKEATFILAVLGALAWTIPIIQFLLKKFKKPILKIHLDDALEIGYEEEGAFITLAIAFTARNHNIFLTSGTLKLIHENT